MTIIKFHHVKERDVLRFQRKEEAVLLTYLIQSPFLVSGEKSWRAEILVALRFSSKSLLGLPRSVIRW